MELHKFILNKTRLPHNSIISTINLLSKDATIPFIARYRKEQTGNLNEVQIEQISLLIKEFEDLSKRRISILKAIEDQGSLTPGLKGKIQSAQNIIELEDLYLPFKKKRKTKADAAREAGLEPLARIIYDQNETDIQSVIGKYLTSKINSKTLAIEGAKDIIAEWINEDARVRSQLRRFYSSSAVIVSKVITKKKEDNAAQKYSQYFDWKEQLNKIPSHRFLAIFRAANEGILRVKIEVEKETALELISKNIIKSGQKNSRTSILKEAIEDALSRLLKPSFYTEFLNLAKRRADDEAILVFADNLEQLLLSAPLGNKRILAIDPGFRSGCKLVCLDENGALLHNENIYPHPPQKEMAGAGKKVLSLVNAYKIEAIAIGNGTASRETEFFIKKIQLERDIPVYVVNEAGASIYSASKIAREEFPDFDITVRGAVSIGRRLSDPLAEFVKIDPKSIGVGQYQHDLDEAKLKDKLTFIVESCVNRVGVNVNTASKELLSYVSGIGPGLAENIVSYRRSEGEIKSREELLRVPRLGARAYEQAAGFLRIKDGNNPLDNSAVHPERYSLVTKISKDVKTNVRDLIGNKDLISTITLEKYLNESLGIATLKDILKELEKPGLDPRKRMTSFQFDPGIKKIEDLREGMVLPGLVNNITNFGCFVDIGIKESGLIHISKLAKEFIKDVRSIVKLNQQLMVTVISIDLDNKRVQLSLVD
ncbi:Tex family protein [soil metagenome]